MTGLLLATALLGYHPYREVVVEVHVDLIEVDSVYRLTETEIIWSFTQVIFWVWRPETLGVGESGQCNAYRVLDWRMITASGQARRGRQGGVECLWTEDAAIYRVTAPKVLRSWTNYDPEVRDRLAWPVYLRRGLPVTGPLRRR